MREMCFLRVVEGQRMTDHKHNEDNTEELEITDTNIVIKILPKVAKTFGKNA